MPDQNYDPIQYIVNGTVEKVTGSLRGEYDPTEVSGLTDYTKVSQVDDPSNFGPGAQWRLQLDVDLGVPGVHQPTRNDRERDVVDAGHAIRE